MMCQTMSDRFLLDIGRQIKRPTTAGPFTILVKATRAFFYQPVLIANLDTGFLVIPEGTWVI